LSKYRLDKIFYYSGGYMDEASVTSAQWLSKHIDLNVTRLCSDVFSRYTALRSYGRIYEGYVSLLSNSTIIPLNSVVYLSQLNVIYGQIVGEYFIWNIGELDSLLIGENKIYTNGGSEAYASVP
ncbi:MAG: hypothetical protein QW279_01155, partial [Candidatus Jordarchaeaceae archaeon]